MKKKSLAQTHPEIAAQWHPTKNGTLTPFDVTCGSTKKVWWKYPKTDDHPYDDHEWQAQIANRVRQPGCSCCAGQTVVKSNCLATTHPWLAAQWHPTKNGTLTPFDVTCGSGEKVWWKYPKTDDHPYDDHEWQACPNDRKKQPSCSCCVGKTVVKSNCLATTHPEIAAQWHPTKNGTLTPFDVTCGSGKRVWWKCPVCDNVYPSKIFVRTRGAKKNKKRERGGCKKCYESKSGSSRWKGVGEMGRQYWNSIERGAKDRNLPITIDMKYAWNVFLQQNRLCALSGRKLTMAGTGKTRTASLDRIDSSKGYVPSNVQWIFKDLQKMKMNLSEDEFIKKCEFVVDYKRSQRGTLRRKANKEFTSTKSAASLTAIFEDAAV